MATPAVAADDWTVLTMAPDGLWGAATQILSAHDAQETAALRDFDTFEVGYGSCVDGAALARTF